MRGREGADPGARSHAAGVAHAAGPGERRTHDYTRHGTTTLFAALNAKTGRIISEFHRRQRAREFRKFLDTLNARVPASLEVHLILDNSSTHKTAAIHRWLTRHPRFHLHFTPTGSSWINLVERWFAALTEKQLRRGAHRSTRELETAIRRYIELTNGPYGRRYPVGTIAHMVEDTRPQQHLVATVARDGTQLYQDNSHTDG